MDKKYPLRIQGILWLVLVLDIFVGNRLIYCAIAKVFGISNQIAMFIIFVYFPVRQTSVATVVVFFEQIPIAVIDVYIFCKQIVNEREKAVQKEENCRKS